MIYLNTDGGARGNPGPSATGVIVSDLQNNVLHTTGTYLGVKTNNEAEYEALIEGLNFILNNNLDLDVVCRLDSELVVKQLNGLYKVKNDRMALLHATVMNLKTKFKSLKFTHVLRSANKLADLTVNKILDEQEKKLS